MIWPVFSDGGHQNARVKPPTLTVMTSRAMTPNTGILRKNMCDRQIKNSKTFFQTFFSEKVKENSPISVDYCCEPYLKSGKRFAGFKSFWIISPWLCVEVRHSEQRAADRSDMREPLCMASGSDFYVRLPSLLNNALPSAYDACLPSVRQ